MEGNNLNQNEQVVTQEQQVATQEPTVSEARANQEPVTNTETNMTESPKKKSMLPLIIIIIVLFLGLGVGLGYYFGTKGKNNGSANSNNDNNSTANKEEKKENTESKKELYNSNDIKIELDKDGVAYITYSEIDAKDKDIVSDVKSYKVVQAGASDVCEGNKRLLFVLNDGTISSLNIDALVCGKKLDIKKKVANLNSVESISQETGKSGANEPTNYLVYVKTSDSKEYDITKVLLGESTSATEVKKDEPKEEDNKDDKKDSKVAYGTDKNTSGKKIIGTKTSVVKLNGIEYELKKEILENLHQNIYFNGYIFINDEPITSPGSGGYTESDLRDGALNGTVTGEKIKDSKTSEEYLVYYSDRCNGSPAYIYIVKANGNLIGRVMNCIDGMGIEVSNSTESKYGYYFANIKDNKIYQLRESELKELLLDSESMPTNISSIGELVYTIENGALVEKLNKVYKVSDGYKIEYTGSTTW